MEIEKTQRVDYLRTNTLNRINESLPKDCVKLREFNYLKAYKACFNGVLELDNNPNDLTKIDESKIVYGNSHRAGMARGFAFANEQPVIHDEQLVVGLPKFTQLSQNEFSEFSKLNEGAKFLEPFCGMESHMAVDYKKLLTIGINGVIKEVTQELKKVDNSGLNLKKGENPQDATEKKGFYLGVLQTLQGVKIYAQNYANYATFLALDKQTKPKRKQELLKIASALTKVPANPATSFYQALQSVWFLTQCLENLYQLGRPDRYLIDFYKKDIASGKITPAQALELIDCVNILYNDLIPQGLAVGYMVGGTNQNGVGQENELTELFLQSITHTKMIYPSVGLCWHKKTPQNIIDISLNAISTGATHPAIFNDALIQKGLIKYGVEPKQACEFVHSTCVEITPCSISGVWVALPYHNLCQYLLNIMDFEHKSLENLIDAFFAELNTQIAKGMQKANRDFMVRYHQGGHSPLASAFVHDCIKLGRDIDRGGAKINWVMPSFVGLANLIDSFVAIKELVYNKKELTIKEFKKILDSNFSGNELLQLRISSKFEHYGNDQENADSFAKIITEHISKQCSKYTNFRGSKVIPSLFCWVMHVGFGNDTGATPDGRKAQTAFGDGSGPAQGREFQGPTASILSSTSWDHMPFIGGIAVNLKFNKSFFNDENRKKVQSLIEVYMEQGGFQTQINVVSKQDLINAQKEPNKYKDLVVRIGGYSDYFTRCSKQMQNELISRTTHSA